MTTSPSATLRLKSRPSHGLRAWSRPSRRSRRGGFTLIELLVVISIIGILIGLILPSGQPGREGFNRAQIQQLLGKIGQAENAYFQKNQRYTADLSALGVTSPQDGYGLSVAVSPPGTPALTFTATATPVAPGLTGDTVLSLTQDPTRGINETPLAGAADARRTAFDAVGAQAASTLTALLAKGVRGESPSDTLEEAAEVLADPKTVARVLRRLDANGDGSVTPAEVLAYDRDPATPLGGFLAVVQKTLQLGAGGEDLKALPGVRLSSLGLSQTGPARFALSIGDGSSVLSGQNGLLPAVQLVGFCDGSVRLTPRVPLDDAPFRAALNPVRGAERSTLLGGTFAVTSLDETGRPGTGLSGILVGLLLPVVQDRPGGGCLRGFALVTGGRGALTGAFGSGPFEMDWADPSLRGPFDATVTGALPAPG